MKDTSFKPLSAFIIALLFVTGSALSAPIDGVVESGQGTISQSGATTTIEQTSNKLRTSWHSFDIGKNEVVNIDQPNAAASIVIGVRNGPATSIDGALNANGHVTLENPAGIQFGASSVVNVGGLVAMANQGALSSLGQINAATKVHLQNLGGNIVNVGGAVSAQEIVVESYDGDVEIGGTVSAQEIVVESYAGDVVIGGAVSAQEIVVESYDGDVVIGATATLSAGAVSAQKIVVESYDGDVEIGGTVSAQEIVVESYAGDVVIDATATLSAGAVSAQKIVVESYESDVVIGGTVSAQEIVVESYDGDVVIGATATLSAGAVSAQKIVVESYAGDVVIGGTVSAQRITVESYYGDVEIGATATLSLTGNVSTNRKVTLEGTDITLSGRVITSGDITVTARGKLLFGNGTNIIRGDNISLTSAIEPTAADVAVITGGTTIIIADGGTITLNAKINVGTAGDLLISTRSGEAFYSVLAGGAIVFGTTAPVELTAKVLRLHTSSTGGERGTHPTTLTAAGATGAEGEAFIEVQGRLNFAYVDITSSGGFKVTDLGAATTEVTSYTSRLDASEMRVNLGNHADAATGGVLASSTSTGGTLLHELFFFAAGDLNWEKGGIDNQIGRVALVSTAYTSISVEGDSVIKGKGVTTDSALRPLPASWRGAHAIWLENTDADSFIFSGALIDTVGDVTIKSEGHIRFPSLVDVFIRGKSVTYEARKEIPGDFRKLDAQIELVALEGDISVTGYLESTTDDAASNHGVTLRAEQGSIILNAKINAGTAGTLTISTRATSDANPGIIAAGAIVFGTTAPVELTAKELLLHTSSTGGTRGTHPTTLTAAGATGTEGEAFIEVQGRLNFTDVNITSSGGFKVPNVGDAYGDVTSYTSTLHASGEMRVKLGTPTNAVGDVLASSTGGSLLHGLSFFALGGIYWDEGGIDNQPDRVVGFFRSYISTSIEAVPVIEDKSVTTNSVNSKEGDSVRQAGVFRRETGAFDDIILTAADFTDAGYTIINGVLDLGADGLFLRAGKSYGAQTGAIVLPTSVTSIRSSSVTLIGHIDDGADLTFTSAGNLSFTSDVWINRSVTLEGTDITFSGRLSSSGDLTVTARGKLIFGNGRSGWYPSVLRNSLYGDNISLTSAIAPTAADVAVLLGGRTRISALGDIGPGLISGGTITLNAKINVGAGRLEIETRGEEDWERSIRKSRKPGGVLDDDGGAIVFGTTAPVELTAKRLVLKTSSSTGGVRGTHPTTLTTIGTEGTEADAFIEVQGSFNFADVNIASSGGFKVPNLSDPYGDITSYTSRLHASGEMRVKLGTPTNAIDGVLVPSTGLPTGYDFRSPAWPGVPILHGLSFFAQGGIYWDEGGIDNQPDRVVGFFRSYISTSIEAVPVIEDKSVTTNIVRSPLPQEGKVESGSGDLSNPERIIQNSQHLRTSWYSFDIGTSEVVNIIQPTADSSIVIGVRNGSATNINGTLKANGHVTLENPAGIQFGASSVVNVGGLLAKTTQGGLSSLGQINAATKVHLQNLGGNIVNVGGAVSAQKIILESKGNVVIGAADLSANEVLISSRGNYTVSATQTPGLKAGVFVRSTGGASITLTEADFTDAGYTIINGVLDLGADGLILRAGDGYSSIHLPPSVTSIRSSSVTLLGFIEGEADLTFTSAGDLSFTGYAWTNRHVTLEGTDINLRRRSLSSGRGVTRRYRKDLTVADGKGKSVTTNIVKRPLGVEGDSVIKKGKSVTTNIVKRPLGVEGDFVIKGKSVTTNIVKRPLGVEGDSVFKDNGVTTNIALRPYERAEDEAGRAENLKVEIDDGSLSRLSQSADELLKSNCERIKTLDGVAC